MVTKSVSLFIMTTIILQICEKISGESSGNLQQGFTTRCDELCSSNDIQEDLRPDCQRGCQYFNIEFLVSASNKNKVTDLETTNQKCRLCSTNIYEFVLDSVISFANAGDLYVCVQFDNIVRKQSYQNINVVGLKINWPHGPMFKRHQRYHSNCPIERIELFGLISFNLLNSHDTSASTISNHAGYMLFDHKNMEIDTTTNGERKHLMCVPGQRLCLCEENTISGQGTYERHGYIYSMLAGLVNIRQKDTMKILEVKSFGNQTIVPVAGDIVTAKVTVLNQRMAKCMITCIGDVTLNRTYRGLLRKEDVRSTEKDRVDMYRSFRPGDVILARVLPHTELHCYQLSTAENELGVVVAIAAESGFCGAPMIPVSWTEMQCPQTLVKEPRKVAKIVPESAVDLKS